MKRASLTKFASIVLAALWLNPAFGAPKDGATILRDEYGIPHIFAKNLDSAAYATGYAQAEDRLEELLKNYRRANGHMAEIAGSSALESDVISRAFKHEEISKARFKDVSPKMQKVCEAFIAGVKQFMKDHPEQVPAWAQEIHPWDIIALGRYIIWGWPLGEVSDVMDAAGVHPDVGSAYHGSNQMLIAAKRTTLKAPIAVIDPHLSWYDDFRFYEERVYAGDFAVSGVAILGEPIPSLGHSRYCSVAMTTGGPLTSDVFEEELNPANPLQYKYDGQWRDMTVRKERIGVKVGDKIEWKEVEFTYSHHGPILGHKKGKAYAAAIPYMNEIGLTDQIYQMFTSRNLAEMKRAISHFQLMFQNIMVATIQGDIFYVRNGRVPIRPKGVDPTKPIHGNTAATEWKGVHPFKDLVQITNPASGYMQNCNVTPFGMMKDSPLTPEKYAKYPYIYNATRTSPLHQRSQQMTETLEKATNVDLDQAIDIAFDTHVFHAELWQSKLKDAWVRIGEGKTDSDAAAVYNEIQMWNRRSDANSTGALAFYAFKKSLGSNASAVDPPANLSFEILTTALSDAASWLKTRFGNTHMAYGTYFRVGREGSDKTWPVGGGSLHDVGMATPRAISFSEKGDIMVGRGGQTSTQIVVMSDPPKSYAIIPLGESDHKASGHWEDQAEKLFSKSIAAPTYFLDKAELMKHVTSTKELDWKR